ncbi:MAG: hypothetical protein JXQ91_11525 [Vannielia sp.]|uniref:hypothetical protein n=1 Tax=Vannielia sp. TaxID=2813045 RepID=UPI003B8CD72E
MKPILATVLIATTTLLAPTAFAAPGGSKANCNANGHRGACAQPLRSESIRPQDYENEARKQQARQLKARLQEQERQQQRRQLKKRGHAPTQAQLRHLPRAPRGQEYRVIDNRVVRIDSDTAQVVAVLGLLSALLR